MARPRGRQRRRSGGSVKETSTASKVILGALGLFSVLYLFSSHILVTRQGPGRTRLAQPGGDQVDGGGGRSGADAVAVDDAPYDGDPRHGGGGAQQLQQQGEPAQGPMDYIPLQCEGGVPDVDLSYWKNIPQDK